MNSRIHLMLGSFIGLIAFSVLLSFGPTGLAAAPVQSGFLMQKTDGTPEVWLMNSTGLALGFDFDLPGPYGSWKIVGVGDFDGDGNPDILWQNTDGTPGIWFLNGTNVVQKTGLSSPGSNWKIVGVGDFNGDGKADILWQATDGTPGMWLMSGANPIAEVGFANPGTFWKIVGAGDFNGDGKSDILWQGADGTPGVWLMNGTTPIAEGGLSNPGSGWKIVAVGDFNGDGRSDIVFQYTDGTPMIWLMNGTSSTAQITLSNPGSSWKVVGTGDFNADGKSDILWQGTDGTPGIWLMNGTTPTAEFALKNPSTSWQIIGAGNFGAPTPLPVQVNDGHTQITTVGSVQTIFNHTTDACDPVYDQPDTSAHAFRSADGTVNLTGNNWNGNWRSTGQNLDSVQRNCTPTYVSPQDTNFSDFKYHEWIYFGYTPDGTNVYALVHNEWYPNLNGSCPSPTTSVVGAATLLTSTNGGASYAHPSPYIVDPAVGWNNFSCSGTYYGLWNISNIIAKGDGYYYALYTFLAIPGSSATSGTCIMRTANLSNASSWQTLSGGSWQQLYGISQCDLLSGLGKFSDNGTVPESVKYSTYLNAYVLIMINNWSQVNYSTSSDLLNWSQPQTILALNQSQVNGLTLYYGSLLDPTDTTLNFDTLGQQTYFYLVYGKPNGDRDIIRQQIRFTTN
jgi:hypothetical protein